MLPAKWSKTVYWCIRQTLGLKVEPQLLCSPVTPANSPHSSLCTIEGKAYLMHFLPGHMSPDKTHTLLCKERMKKNDSSWIMAQSQQKRLSILCNISKSYSVNPFRAAANWQRSCERVNIVVLTLSCKLRLFLLEVGRVRSKEIITAVIHASIPVQKNQIPCLRHLPQFWQADFGGKDTCDIGVNTAM